MRRYQTLLLKTTLYFCIAVVAALTTTSALNAQSAPPPTERQNVTESCYGQTVTDPYRWLENWHEPKVAQWMKAQDDYTRATLNRIPGRDNFLVRAKALDTASTRVRGAQIWGGKLFYLKADAGADNLKLYIRDSAISSSQSKERLLLDPELLTKDGVHFSIDYFQPSLDGNLVLYGISPGGSEDSVIHVLETATGKQLPDAIDRCRFGAVAWLPGNQSFVYNRLQKLTPDMPRTAYKQRSRVHLHELGHDPEDDRFVFGYGYSEEMKSAELKSELKIADNDLSFITYSPASPYLIGLVAHGTENEATAYYVPLHQMKPSPIPWKKLFDVDDAVVRFDLHQDDIYLVTHKHKPRYEVTRTSLKHPDIEHATVVVPASEVVIQEADVAKDAIYIRDLDGGIGRMRRLSFDGKIEPVSAGEGKSVQDISTTPTEPGARVHVVSWTTTPRWLAYDPQRKAATDTGIQPPLPVDTSAYEAVEVKAKSADGTNLVNHLPTFSAVCAHRKITARRVTDRPLTTEMEVIRALAKDKSNKEIGAALNISEGAVKVHVTHMLETLKITGCTEAIG